MAVSWASVPDMPAQIGPYRVDREIGRGGMGVVYLARDTKLGREVAIKALPADLAEDEKRLIRFEREARLLASLNHPNIGTIYGLEEADNRKYLVLEYVDGESLSEFVNRTPSWRKCVEAAASIAEALAAAHASGVVHRDIKPDNVLFTKNGVLKILDFGLALPVATPDEDGSGSTTIKKETLPGAVMGTPGYMSPEQVRGMPADTRSDIFSFGCLLHEMLTGRPTFARETVADSMAATLKDKPINPVESGVKIPAELDRIIMRCLEKEPRDRFQSARDLAFSLRNALSASDPAIKSGIAPGAAPDRRWWWAVGAAALIGLIALGSWLLRPKPEDTAAIRSLAVLPFVNESGDPDAAFLSDGIAESIINRMATIPELRVVPRNTAFLFRDYEGRLDEIARELDVRAILTAHVLRRGDELKISVSLEDVEGRRQIWGHPFNVQLDNILELEADIADQVAEALRLQLTGDQRSRLARGGTDSPEAHVAYWNGRFLRRRETAEGVQQAIAAFRRAIDEDPEFAAAWAGLASVYLNAIAWSVMPQDEAKEKYREALDKALKFDPTDVAAITERAAGAIMIDWDWKAAQDDLRQALSLDPEHALTRHRLGHVLALLGRYDEARAEFERAARAEPRAPMHLECLGANHVQLGRYADAERVLNEALKWEPNYAPAYRYLAWVADRRGQLSEALEFARKAVDASARANPDSTSEVLDLSLFGYYAARNRDEEEARRRLKELEDRRKEEGSFVALVEIARVHVGLGEFEEALDLLEEAVEDRSASWLPGKLIEVGFEPLRGHPRFDDLFPLMGLQAPPPLADAAATGQGVPRIAVLPFDLVGMLPEAEYLAGETRDAYL